MNLRKVCSTAHAFNARSLRYGERCGYKQEGLRKKQFFIDGRYVDEVLTAVFKSDFMPLWREYKKKHFS